MEFGLGEAKVVAAMKALGGRATLREISEFVNAQPSYVLNVLSNLRSIGIVEAMSGSGFGFFGSTSGRGSSREKTYVMIKSFEDVFEENEDVIMGWAKIVLEVDSMSKLLAKLDQAGKKYRDSSVK
ncbi:MAG: hypothetical protein ABR867_04470 [Nitrososphaerales archaeon]|jgi:hypothetical protein